jgi:hypothetical protein
VVGLSSKRIPNRQEVARKSSLPLGMLVCPLAPMLKPTPCLRRPAVACATCGGYINKYCQRNFAKGEWKCVLCDATNTNQDEYGDESCAQFPEFTNKVRSHSQTFNCCSPQREPSQLTLTINERAVHHRRSSISIRRCSSILVLPHPSPPTSSSSTPVSFRATLRY